MRDDLHHAVVTALHLGPATFAMLMARVTGYDARDVYRALTALRKAQLAERIAIEGVLAHPIWRIPTTQPLPEQLADLPDYHQKLMQLAMGVWPQEGPVEPAPGTAQQVYEDRKAGRTSEAVAARIRARFPKRNALPTTFNMERACIVALYEGHASTHGVLRRITANYMLVPGVLDIFDVEDCLREMQTEGKLGRTGEVTGNRWFLKPHFFRDKPHRIPVLLKQAEREVEEELPPPQQHVVSIEQHILGLIFGGK